jgi:serine/threonine-protein phosphatase 2A regulatory subunit B
VLVLQANKSFFSEIIASISDIRFSRDGRYILARDYMTLKLWDLNMESRPVATFQMHEHLRARVRPGHQEQLHCTHAGTA